MTRFKNTMMGAVLLATACMILAPTATCAEELMNCPINGDSGDNLSRGFYIPNYPGTSLDQVDLVFSPTVAGDYTIRLTVREATYDGPVIGVVEVTENLPLVNPMQNPVSFFFPALSVTPNSTVTFALEMLGGPDWLYYGVNTIEASCPIIQTSGTTPPLDSPRRDGVIVTIHGTGVTAEEPSSWSRIKAVYR